MHWSKVLEIEFVEELEGYRVGTQCFMCRDLAKKRAHANLANKIYHDTEDMLKVIEIVESDYINQVQKCKVYVNRWTGQPFQNKIHALSNGFFLDLRRTNVDWHHPYTRAIIKYLQMLYHIRLPKNQWANIPKGVDYLSLLKQYGKYVPPHDHFTEITNRIDFILNLCKYKDDYPEERIQQWFDNRQII